MATPLRVLLVEDMEDDAALVVRELRRGGYEPTYERVDTGPAMKAALDKQPWDIVISDHNMPNFSSLGALRLLQSTGLDIPFIIASAVIGEDVAVAAMRSGAQDYVLKANLGRLPAAVERELQEAEVRRARRRAEQEERRLLQELQEQHQQLEQRVRELTALNRLFQQHLSERSAGVQGYKEVLDGLQRVQKEINALVDRAKSQALPELQDVANLDPGSGGAPQHR